MMKPQRELTPKEIRSVRKLVTVKCANYDKEYGCLPLDCACPMLNICYTHSAMCSYFRESVLPNDPELSAAFQPLPTKRCKHCGKPFPVTGARCTALQIALMQPAGSRQQPGYENTEKRRWICNDYALKKHCSAMTFRGCFHIPSVFVPGMQILPL